MNTNSTFEKLEFDKILSAISHYTLCEATRLRIMGTTVLTNMHHIKKLHTIVGELRLFFENKGQISFNKLYDLSDQLKFIKKKRFLESTTLYKIAFSVNIYENLKKTLPDEIYPQLASIFTVENIDNILYQNILVNINEEGFIDDRASQNLSEIRKGISEMDSRIDREINNFYRVMEKSKYTTDSIITIRNGFPCVLINPSFKRKIDGVVIDSSASGQTVFVTSNRIIGLHNELISLLDDEKKEITRILIGYTDSIRDDATMLSVVNSELLFFDEIHAKTLYSIKNHLNSPEIISTQIINLIDARHPLLNQAVPLTVKLGGAYSILVITGPNAGGKTVALKTIGLLVLMTQSGIPIPASSSSQIGIFQRIFVSIGDDQSIENALSTFSAQILDLLQITGNASDHSLVLLDELGTGTDPIEGSALAISVTLFLRDTGALSVITTHFEELKYLASNEDGIKNASMKFDIQTISPLYEMETGIPGKSFAFEISSRLGLPKKIIDTAKKYVNNDYLKISTMLNEIYDKKNTLDKQQFILQKLEQELQEKSEDYKSKEEKIKKREQEIKTIMRARENDFLIQARKEFEQLVKNIKENSASKESIKNGKQFLERLNEKINIDFSNSRSKKNDKNITNEFKVGDAVFILPEKSKGVIVAKANSQDEFVVQIGSITMIISASDLEGSNLVHNKKNTKITNKITIEKTKTKTTLDLRGIRYEKAIDDIEKFIDEAIANNIGEIKIIHGVGTGAIRQCVQQSLSKSPFVKSYDFEKNNKQGINFGVTVACLK